ncbi:hypothetical protein E2C01_092125 [Portunus trituberculatus]|uniref:Uncharacterized protein n=1 Tax=Portunus trituberculatus TaxID=210409 RepID=A0A5B7JR79_PORTR|nr:hypothetical protein [Portunus trituberculatus]
MSYPRLLHEEAILAMTAVTAFCQRDDDCRYSTTTRRDWQSDVIPAISRNNDGLLFYYSFLYMLTHVNVFASSSGNVVRTQQLTTLQIALQDIVKSSQHLYEHKS